MLNAAITDPASMRKMGRTYQKAKARTNAQAFVVAG
jgi:hypothetical protein